MEEKEQPSKVLRHMRIGEVGRMLGVSRDTLIRFEARRMIQPARDWAGHRRFSEEDVERVRELLTGGQLTSRDQEEP